MKKTKLKNIIYEDPSIVYSEQLKLNVCCFRELEDVNVFLFCVIDSLHFVPESELFNLSTEADRGDFLERSTRAEQTAKFRVQ